MNHKLKKSWILLLTVIVGALAVACSASADSDDDDGINPELWGRPGYRFDTVDLEVDLTAKVAQWEVYEGETIEIWGYNGEYPGPTIRAQEGDRVRVNLHNELPEATTIHFHGMDVPNDQDGVPGVTQPDVAPGQSWTYEFIAGRVGTTAYHTHSNTAMQIGKGLFGTFVVEDGSEAKYDHEFELALHEIQGFYTINGHSFPATLANDLMSIKSGETALIRFVNMGSLSHPMHLHGHQFEVIAIDANPLVHPMKLNTVDIAPGQTVDVVITGDNPGTWVFHCHIVPHVTNKGVYPGGMLTLLDYEDHTSYFEDNTAFGVPPQDVSGNVTDGEDNDDADDVAGADKTLKISAAELMFDKFSLFAAAGADVTVEFANDDLNIPHNISFYEKAGGDPIAIGEIFSGIETRPLTFTAPGPGTYFFKCDVHPDTMVGEFIVK